MSTPFENDSPIAGRAGGPPRRRLMIDRSVFV
jgi:hypothetical protein